MKQEKDENGFYYLDTEYAKELLQNDGVYIEDDGEIYRLKKDIWRMWKDQKKPLTNEILDNDSKADNGLQFKHYVFAEYYLKYGNITKVCKDLNISRPTAYEWLKRDDVTKYLQERQQEIKEEYKQVNDNLYMACMCELNDIITSFNQTPDKIKAIDTYLKHYANMKRLKADAGHSDTEVKLIDDVTE